MKHLFNNLPVDVIIRYNPFLTVNLVVTPRVHENQPHFKATCNRQNYSLHRLNLLCQNKYELLNVAFLHSYF